MLLGPLADGVRTSVGVQTGAHTSLFLYVYAMGTQVECFVTGSGPVPYFCYHACALLSRVQLFATPWTEPSRLLCPWAWTETGILEWLAISFSRRPAQPRNQT